jgi:hypothetical protein
MKNVYEQIPYKGIVPPCNQHRVEIVCWSFYFKGVIYCFEQLVVGTQLGKREMLRDNFLTEFDQRSQGIRRSDQSFYLDEKEFIKVDITQYREYQWMSLIGNNGCIESLSPYHMRYQARECESQGFKWDFRDYMRDGKSVSSSHFRLAIVQSNLGEQFQITL